MPWAQPCWARASGGGIRSATFCLGFLQALDQLRLLPMFDYLSTVSGGGFVGGCWSAWIARTEVSADLGACTLPAGLNPNKIDGLRWDPHSGRLTFHGRMSDAARDALLAAFRQQLHTGGPPPRAVLNKISSFCDRAQTQLPAPECNRTFPPPEQIEPDRPPDIAEQSPSKLALLRAHVGGPGSIHHLRLFSNYLTPRKGLLSTDTWRAILVVLRNLVMNWLVVLPILFAVIAVPRIYFAAEPGWTTGFRNHPDHFKTWPPSVQNAVRPAGHSAYVLTTDLQAIQHILHVDPEQKASTEALKQADLVEGDYLAVLRARAEFAAIPLLIVFSWQCILSGAWMTCA